MFIGWRALKLSTDFLAARRHFRRLYYSATEIARNDMLVQILHAIFGYSPTSTKNDKVRELVNGSNVWLAFWMFG